jgi:hypothetical protein
MERLLPVMFQGYFDDVMWMVLAELSYFYIQLCAKEIVAEMMQKFKNEMTVLLCKMEKNFPPGFFNLPEVKIEIPERMPDRINNSSTQSTVGRRSDLSHISKVQISDDQCLSRDRSRPK